MTANAHARPALLVRVGSFVLLLVALSAIMTYPVITNITGVVAGPPGDNFEYVYKLWWFEHALFEKGQSPFFLPQVFYPFGYDIALSETTLANTVLGLPLTAATGEVGAYNVLILWSFVVSGLGAFLFVRYVTGSTAAGAIAGLTFAFLPYRTGHVGTGHLPLMGTGWLPFLLLYEERLIRRLRLRDGLLAGLFYGLFALSSWYYAYMGVLVAGLYALLRARPWPVYLRNGRLWLGALAGGVLTVLLVAPAAIPLLRLAARGEIARSTLSLRYVDQWSASVADYLFPSIMHPLWGQSLVSAYPQNVHENLLWLGLIPLALSTYTLLRRRSAVVGAMAAVGLVAFILSLGTTWHWAGEPVYIGVPPVIENTFSRLMYALSGGLALNPAAYSSLQRAGEIVIPLPTLVLYLFLPFFNAMRVWARFGLVVGLAVAVLAGCGTAALLRRPQLSAAARTLVTLLLGLGILFDFATVPYPFGVSTVGPQAVDDWLRSQPGDFAVLELPVEKTWHGPALYAQRQSGKKIAYGYGTYQPKTFSAWQQRLAGFPDDESLRAIEEAGIRYVLVGLHSYGAREADMRRQLAGSGRLHLAATFEEHTVLRGDSLINKVRPLAIVPPTELIGAVRYAYLADEIAVYEIVDR